MYCGVIYYRVKRLWYVIRCWVFGYPNPQKTLYVFSFLDFI